MSDGRTTELVVLDQIEPCPYLPERMARMPLRTAVGQRDPVATDVYLHCGYRRAGEFVYQTECPSCQACEAIRIPVNGFQWSEGFRRILRRGDRRYRQHLGPLVASSERVQLFNRHRGQRGLQRNDSEIDLEDYHWGFVRSCFRSFELAWYADERLVALAICDQGHKALSAVYTFYDPDLRGDSLGTYAILKQLQVCEERRLDWLYLGYYVAECPHMNYKIRFVEHERLIEGEWRRFGPGDVAWPSR